MVTFKFDLDGDNPEDIAAVMVRHAPTAHPGAELRGGQGWQVLPHMLLSRLLLLHFLNSLLMPSQLWSPTNPPMDLSGPRRPPQSTFSAGAPTPTKMTLDRILAAKNIREHKR